MGILMKHDDLSLSVRATNRSSSHVSGKRSERWFRPQFEMLEHRCLLSVAPSTVVGRFVFYDNSRYDGGIAGVNSSDDNAIASDKSAYIPGSGPATFANVISYDKGINGIMIDVANLPAGALTA